MSFRDKVVIITGGSQGIGAAAVDLFLEQGAKVASLDIVTRSGASDPNRLDINCDITSEASVQAAVKEVLEKFHDIDILANIAGVMDNIGKHRNSPATIQASNDSSLITVARVTDTENAMWNKCFAVNVTGPFLLIRQCVNHFLGKDAPHKGAIVNVCSTASVRGACAGAAYTASKHALLGLTRSVVWQYAKDGIKCNAVLPGGTKTNILQNMGSQIDPTGYSTIAPYINIMPGQCEPVDIARTILFCAAAEGVNGAEIVVDHGWTCA